MRCEQARGRISSVPSGGTPAELPLLSASIVAMANELSPSAPLLVFDPFASHIVRIILLVLSGRAVPDDRSGITRSRKSSKFRKRQGKMSSFMPKNEQEESEGKDRYAVPPEFDEARERLCAALVSLDSAGDGSGIRAAAMDAVAAPVVRIVVELEMAEDRSLKASHFADALLFSAFSDATALKNAEDVRGEYLGGLVRHAAGSTVFEAIVTCCSDEIFAHVWRIVFVSRLQRLAANAVANFVVAQAIDRLDAKQLKAAVKEFADIATERRAEWIDNSRTGVLKALVDRAASLRKYEKDIVDVWSHAIAQAQL